MGHNNCHGSDIKAGQRTGCGRRSWHVIHTSSVWFCSPYELLNAAVVLPFTEAVEDPLECSVDWVSRHRFFASQDSCRSPCRLFLRLPQLRVEMREPVGLSQALEILIECRTGQLQCLL